MAEYLGVGAAVLSSGLGGASIGATRYLVGALDPLAIGSFRFGIGFVLLLPVALIKAGPWPARRDWAPIAGLGVLYFCLFPILFNASLIFTTASRGALALSTLPLLTLGVGAMLGVEPLTIRKSLGVLLAMAGVGFALMTGLASAPAGAWRGELLMIMAALCMALYSIGSRPLIRRTGPIPFTVVAMGAGALCLIGISVARHSFAPVATLGAAQWLAALFLGTLGSALTFFLWAFALERTTPTRVAISATVNPMSASLVGILFLHEPFRWNLLVGIVTVFLGIWIASRDGPRGAMAVAKPGFQVRSLN